MSKIMGRAQIKVNGQMLDTVGGSTLDIGGVDRETVNGDNKVLGFQEKPKPSKLECEIVVKAGTSAAEVGRWDNITTTTESDTGQTWVQSGAWVTTTPTVTTADGKMKITIEGPPAEEMQANG